LFLLSTDRSLSLRGFAPTYHFGFTWTKSSNENAGSPRTKGGKRPSVQPKPTVKVKQLNSSSQLRLTAIGGGVDKNRWAGAPKKLFFGRGVKSYVTIKPENLHLPRRLNYSNFRFTRMPSLPPHSHRRTLTAYTYTPKHSILFTPKTRKE